MILMEYFTNQLMFRITYFFLILKIAFSKDDLQEVKPIFEVDIRTHGEKIIENILSNVYQNLIPLNQDKNAYTLLSNKNIDDKIDCRLKTKVKYYLENLREKNQFIQASECRTNFNYKMKSILIPNKNIHIYAHESKDQIEKQIQYVIAKNFKSNKELSKYNFYSFKGVDYSFACLVGYRELMQIILNESVVEASIKVQVEVPESCGFHQVNKNFGNKIYHRMNISIPIDGTFFCLKGKSSSCNYSIAEINNPKYKLIT